MILNLDIKYLNYTTDKYTRLLRTIELDSELTDMYVADRDNPANRFDEAESEAYLWWCENNDKEAKEKDPYFYEDYYFVTVTLVSDEELQQVVLDIELYNKEDHKYIVPLINPIYALVGFILDWWWAIVGIAVVIFIVIGVAMQPPVHSPTTGERFSDSISKCAQGSTRACNNADSISRAVEKDRQRALDKRIY